MADFKKILDHVEKDKIIGKLVNGETPKDVANYLKLKFNKKEESHLRLTATLLQEFIDKYLDQYKNLSNIIADEKAGKTDKAIFESLQNNKSFRKRLDEMVDGEIDLKKKLQSMITLLEARFEQVFDKIQENPHNMKGDYVLLKYFEAATSLITAADKVINQRPDKLIQHDISITMIEQHSVAFQDIIKELLLELDPEGSNRFIEKLTRRLSGMQPEDVINVPKRMTFEARGEEVKNILEAASIVDDDYDFENIGLPEQDSNSTAS